MNTQHGGAFSVSGYIALAILSLAICEAGVIRHLLKHRQIVIEMNMKPTAIMELPATTIRPPDEYRMHSFPKEKAASCDGFNTICWIRI